MKESLALYTISADGGKTFTTQWLTVSDVNECKSRGYIVQRKPLNIFNSENQSVKKPCIGCVYFKVCGETTRTEPCNGRVTKREQKNQRKLNK